MTPTAAPSPPAAPPAATPHPCANCGADAPSRYCPECGQATRERVVSMGEMTREFLDDHLSLNSRLARTVGPLLLRPGRLTREYLGGRRARYVRPVRLYLGAIVVFLLTFSLARPGGELGPELPTKAGAPAPLPAPPLGPAIDVDGPAVRIQLQDGGGVGTLRLGGRVIPVGERLARLEQLGTAEVVDLFARGFERYLPRIMIVLLPVFALLLKLLYVRRRRHFVEHFVFALHFHAFAFLVFAAVLLTPVAWQVALLGWLHLYLLIALHAVYGQGWMLTGAKFAALVGSYFFAVAAAFVLLVIATILLV